eukprot:gene38868-51099_t
MARGGKTTVLLALFDQLKADSKNVMFISFNGSSNFKRLVDESEEEAFYRVVAAQLVAFNGYNGRVVPDWETLDSHIGDSPFVLLVDEINVLSFPVSGVLATILKKYFLDKADRYLVISSHLPVDLDAEFNRESAGSVRACEVLSLPICTKVQLLCSMGDRCANIRAPVIAYYGGIPSLIYCEKQNGDFSPEDRFRRYSFPSLVISEKSFLDFVDELMDGKRVPIHSDIRYLDKLASLSNVTVGGKKEQRIHWPLCYVGCILDTMMKSRSYYCPVSEHIVTFIKRIEVFQQTSNVGNWWEEVVKIAFLLRFVQSANSFYTAGLFGLCEANEAYGAVISVIQLDPTTTTVRDAKKAIESVLNKFTYGCQLVLFHPYCESLQQFDGFIAFNKTEQGLQNSIRRIIGYQCKAGKETSYGNIPKWMFKAVLLRGKAKTNAAYPRSWIHASHAQVKAFLGFSLEMLYDLYNETT